MKNLMLTNRSQKNLISLLMLAAVFLGINRLASAQQQTATIAETVVDGLDHATDFSITEDGDIEVIFIAELGAEHIRRIKGDEDAIVVSGIAVEDDPFESIAVQAISSNRILVGVSGISESKQSLRLFDVSALNLPRDFNEQHLEHTRIFQRSLKRVKAINVLRIFSQQKGLSMVCRLGNASPSLCDIHLKEGNLERLAEQNYEKDLTETARLSTITVDPMGGYLAALSQYQPQEIVFYRAEGKRMQQFRIDLENIVSLNFSPTHDRMFAIVSTPKTDDQGDSSADGIYEILSAGDACRSRFVMGVNSPQKMKFDASGNAWVLCGPEEEGGDGLLKKITGLDVTPANKISEEVDSDDN